MRRNVTADMIRQAILRRHLEELRHAEAAHSQNITNNVYGGHGGSAGGGGLSGMREVMGEPEDRDYFVDIERRDLPPEGEGGKSPGWTKKVHRFSHDKKKS